MNSSEHITPTPRSQTMVLPLLCIASFCTLLNLRAISPILVDISAEFGITVAVAGTLGAAFSIPALILSLFFGPISDRYGRRSLIIIGLFILFLASIGSMFAPTFSILFVSRMVSGFGYAAVSPSVFAAVGDHFPYSERGRAFGWLISATTMAVVLGIPVGSLLAGNFNWRWMFGLLAIVFLVVTLLIALRLPVDQPTGKPKSAGFGNLLDGFKQISRSRSAIAALLSSLFFGLCWQGWGTYNGAFFVQSLGVSTENLAPIYTIQGLAILASSQIGGFFSDRFTKKSLAIVGMIASGIFLVVLTSLGNSLITAIILNTLMVFPSGLRFVAGNALVSELIPKARGTFMAMNSSSWEVGSMLGATLGGFVLTSAGTYTALGITFGSSAAIAAVILYFFVVEVGNINQKDPGPMEPVV